MHHLSSKLLIGLLLLLPTLTWALPSDRQKPINIEADHAQMDDKIGVTHIFTDGDLRRVIAQSIDVHTTTINKFMTTGCKTGHPDMLAAEILELMQRHKINALLIVDDQQQLVGAINMHDLLRAGVV